MPMNATPHMIDQIQPTKMTVKTNWRSPTNKLRHIVPQLPNPDCPGLPQQKTENPAMIVPSPGTRMLKIRQNTAMTIGMAGIAARQALPSFLCITTEVCIVGCVGAKTTVVCCCAMTNFDGTIIIYPTTLTVYTYVHRWFLAAIQWSMWMVLL